MWIMTSRKKLYLFIIDIFGYCLNNHLSKRYSCVSLDLDTQEEWSGSNLTCIKHCIRIYIYIFSYLVLENNYYLYFVYGKTEAYKIM